MQRGRKAENSKAGETAQVALDEIRTPRRITGADRMTEIATAKTLALTAVHILEDRLNQMHAECPNENLWAEANDQIRFLTQIVTDWE